MIKSWPINKDSDSYDLMTYVWLEVTNVRVKIDEAIDFYQLFSSEKDLQTNKSYKKDLIKNIEEIFMVLEALDCIEEEIKHEIKNSRIWNIYSHHKWIEAQRLFDLKQKLSDLENDNIKYFYPDKMQPSRLH